VCVRSDAQQRASQPASQQQQHWVVRCKCVAQDSSGAPFLVVAVGHTRGELGAGRVQDQGAMGHNGTTNEHHQLKVGAGGRRPAARGGGGGRAVLSGILRSNTG
jgi:hypothetical protein